MGPFGSGKSSGCVFEIVKRAIAQAPGKDGIRRTRWAVIRNTYPELRDTTIKTVKDWLPPEYFGTWKAQEHTYTITGIPDCEIEILFRALDRPDHVGKLLSLELTGAWVNEAREIPKSIWDAIQGRVGRFPSRKDKPADIPATQWPTWYGVFGDTNPPDDDHWWYELFEERKPINARGFKQPGGMSLDAENRSNLPTHYYENLRIGKDPEFVKVFVDGEYGSIMDGKAIYAESWSDRLHVAEHPLPVMRDLPLLLGFDFGLTPACVIAQLSPLGQLRILDELVSEDLGITNFIKNKLRPHLANNYPKMRLRGYGDPAGTAKAPTDEKTCFQILGNFNIPTQPARSNKPKTRWEAVRYFLSRLVDKGEPAFLLSPNCKTLRKGFNGGYKLRRMLVPGEERFQDKADKNRFSHPHDALQYLALHAESEDDDDDDDYDYEPEPVAAY